MVSNDIMKKYQPVIGLEIHAQMKTKSKAFCSCSTTFRAAPNSNVCPICLGHPGCLPVLNEELVNFGIKMGLATNCKIRERSIFARKNYFYPDLTKGYQITQYETPLCYDGYIKLKLNDGTEKKIGITRIHLEEDAGKSIHDFSDNETIIDFNRCGVPLIEIVSEPDINSPEEAVLYVQKIRQLLIYLGICDGNMEEGSLRCDANISIRPVGSLKLGTRTEIKNLNSFKNIYDALQAEIKRQTEVIEQGGYVYYTTMTYNAKDKKTIPTRSKEEAHDYRYFPEPDLVYLKVDKDWVERIRVTLPEFPDVKQQRFQKQYGIPEYDARILTEDQELANYFEEAAKHLPLESTKGYKNISNLIMTEVLRVLNEDKISINEFPIKSEHIAKIAELIITGIVNSSTAKEIFAELLKYKGNKTPEDIIKEKDLLQVSDTSEIENIIKTVISQNPKEVERYKAGEQKLFSFLVGQVMRSSKGKANPKIVNELLKKLLDEI